MIIYQYLSCHQSQPIHLGSQPKTAMGKDRKPSIYVCLPPPKNGPNPPEECKTGLYLSCFEVEHSTGIKHKWLLKFWLLKFWGGEAESEFMQRRLVHSYVHRHIYIYGYNYSYGIQLWYVQSVWQVPVRTIELYKICLNRLRLYKKNDKIIWILTKPKNQNKL